MKAMARCPECEKEFETNCEGCISSHVLLCYNCGQKGSPKVFNVEWEIKD